MSNQESEVSPLDPPELPPRSLRRRPFPICPKCNQSCASKDNNDGDLVRAFNQVYHYRCFTCEDCQKTVADKYYPIESPRNSRRKFVLCEYHHLQRLGFICLKCDKPMTTAEQKYHSACIQCPSCVTPTLSQYEFKGTSYCRLHYSLLPETHCNGCDQAIVKQFVEHRDLPNKIWHPECYMIFKFWSVKLAPASSNPAATQESMTEAQLIDIQMQIETKVTRVWTDLSSFEESSANCISDMLLNVAAGAYIEGIRMANQFIMHLEVLFSALDIIRSHLEKQNQELDCNTEAKAVCNQMIRFFELLTIPTPKTAETNTTQELLSLVTGLAQNLKSLIRIGLSAALYLERELGIGNSIFDFLNQLLELEKKRVWIAGRYWFKDPPPTNTNEELLKNGIEYCQVCHLTIENTHCYQYEQQRKWHPNCFRCTRCSNPLDASSALFSPSSNTLYCQSCFATNGDEGVPLASCIHITLLKQYLDSLKLYLAKLSASSSSSNAHIFGVSTKHPSTNEIVMPETKRQKSILRMLGGRATTKPSRMNSVNLGQIQQISSTTLQQQPQDYDQKQQTPFYAQHKKKNSSSLMISTDTSTTTQQQQSSPTAISPVMVLPKSTNKITSSIRRTFSTNSHSPRRLSLHGIFDLKRGGAKAAAAAAAAAAEARRASILTLDTMTGQTTNKTMYLSSLTPMQDFAVRHVAVITIRPLITPPFSLDELTDLIDIKKSSKKRTSTADQPASVLWGKLLTHIKASTSTQTTKKSAPLPANKTFGVPLSLLLLNNKKLRQNDNVTVGVTLRDLRPTLAASFSDNASIPLFVKSCILAILQSDMSIEGVFRKNGNIRQLKVLSEKIDHSTSTNDMDALLSNENSVQLAALLKRFLREMPEPLMTFSLYPLFVRCGKMIAKESPEEKRKILHLACCLLPKANRDTMLLIFSCLKWVASFSDTNKMDIPNLARVIAPNVLYNQTVVSSSPSLPTADLRQGAQEEIDVIETLIREADQISVVPSELVLFSIQEGDISNIDSKVFIKHYIQLLDDLKRRKSKSENNSPTTTASNGRRTQSTLLLKHQIGVPQSRNIAANHIIPSSPRTPTPTATTTNKQRRTSWIPNLTAKK